MKKITLILILPLTTFLFSQQVFKLDSTLTQNWDIPNTDWVNFTKTHYYYDTGGIKDTRIYQFSYTNDVWDSIARQTRTFNGTNLIDDVTESYDGSQWNFTARTEFEYNGNNQVTLEEVYFFAGSWLNSSSQENTYNNSNDITEELSKTLDFISNQLINDSRSIYSYNGSNLLDQELSQNWLGGMWFNEFRRDHFYLSNGLLDYIDRFEWLGAVWSSDIERSQLIYNNDDLISEAILQTGSINNLENVSRLINTYDIVPNLIQIVGQEWNGSGWDNFSNLIQNYDSDNNIEEQITQAWDIPNNNWLNQIRFLSYWSPTENLSVSFIETLDFNIYPNPVKNILQIEFSKTLLSSIEAALYDISGREIKSIIIHKGRASFQMPIAEEALGTYILKIKNGGHINTYKIIKN